MHTRFFPAVILAVVAVFFSGTPEVKAGVVLPEVLSVDFSGNLSRWDAATYNRSMFARSGVGGIASMARTLDGRYVMYRTSYSSLGGTPGLYQINPVTGQTALLIESANAADKVVALTHTRDGDFLASDNERGFLRIDPVTLGYTPISLTRADNGADLRSSGGMATAPNGDVYTWATGSHDGYLFSNLFRIDLETQTGFRVAGFDEINHTKGLNAIAFTPDGRLFAFTDINSGTSGELFQTNSVYEIHLATGRIDLFTPSSGLGSSILGSIRGAEFIPEPATIALLAPMLLMTGRTQRRGGR